jgi:hypothetical protein
VETGAIMPRILRSMKMEDGKPKIERSASALGVRVYTSGTNDIVVSSQGDVEPGRGGMSVVPSLRAFRLHQVPRRLNHLIEGAEGNNTLYVWRMGTGEFTNSPVTTELMLQPDTRTVNVRHGVVEPIRKMPLDEYERALSNTRDAWIVDETGT